VASNIQFNVDAASPFVNKYVFRKVNNKLRLWLAATVDAATGNSTPSVEDGKGINRPDTEWLEECGLPQVN
jgi:hypothetical protein